MALCLALSPVQYGWTPGPSKHCQPPLNGRISMIVSECCMGLVDSRIIVLRRCGSCLVITARAGVTTVRRKWVRDGTTNVLRTDDNRSTGNYPPRPRKNSSTPQNLQAVRQAKGIRRNLSHAILSPGKLASQGG